MKITKLPKKIQDIIISAYQIGYWDRDAKLALFNNLITNEEPILYLEAEKQEEIDLELIDSVS